MVRLCRANGVHAESLQGDFATPASTEAFLLRYREKFPDTEVLINNVGNFFKTPPLQTSFRDWHELFQTNLHAPFMLIQGLAESFKKHKGNIVNIGVAGLETMEAKTGVAYGITKQGLLMLTKALAKELAADQVRVNMVSPGILNNSVGLPDDPNLLPVPMKRTGTPYEVARVIAFLLDPESSYITGQNIEVAGGAFL